MAVGLEQGPFIPDPDVLNGHVMVFDLFSSQVVIDLKVDLLDIIQVICLTGKIDIIGDVG